MRNRLTSPIFATSNYIKIKNKTTIFSSISVYYFNSGLHDVILDSIKVNSL